MELKWNNYNLSQRNHLVKKNVFLPDKALQKQDNLTTAGRSFNSLATLESDQRGNEFSVRQSNEKTHFPINSSIPAPYEFLHEYKAKRRKERKELSEHIYKTGYKTSLAQAYGKFLQELGEKLDFTWYATLTFREPVHPEAANKRFNRWIHNLNRKIYGVRYWKRKQGVRWVKAIEHQKRGVIHFHCLIADIPGKWDPELKDLRRLRWMDEWWKSNGIARIFAYDKTQGACYYLGKYVNKAESEIDFSDNIAFAMQQQLSL